MDFLIKASQQLCIVRYYHYPLVTPAETKEQRHTGEFISEKERERARDGGDADCFPHMVKVGPHHGGAGLVTKSCLTLATPRTVACQAPLSMGFSRQDYWSGFPCSPPRDVPDPGIEPRSSALRTDSLPSLSHFAVQQRLSQHCKSTILEFF